VRSSFEKFIETNLMVQSKFNLVFWFVSYNIFYLVELVDPPLDVTAMHASLLLLPPAQLLVGPVAGTDSSLLR
jgi:hypothetical protein